MEERRRKNACNRVNRCACIVGIHFLDSLNAGVTKMTGLQKFWDEQKYRVYFWLIHAVIYPVLFFLLFSSLPGADFNRLLGLIGFGG